MQTGAHTQERTEERIMKKEGRKKTIKVLFGEAADANFLQWLDDMGYYEAPAAVNHHGNYEGGLYEHSMQVTCELMELTEKLSLQWGRAESPMVVGMLHDICKVDDYAWEIVDGQKIPVKNQNKRWAGHGDKSLEHLQTETNGNFTQGQ